MDAHARRSDPVQSHETVRSIAADASMEHQILAVVHHYTGIEHPLVTDDELLAGVEAISGRRRQRNVVARCRGLMEQGGLLEQGPDRAKRHTTRLPLVAPVQGQLL